MKKILLIVAIIVVIAGMIYLVRMNNSQENADSNGANGNETVLVSGVDVSTVEGAKSLIEKIYGESNEELPMFMTDEIDSSDLEVVKSYTGLSSNQGIEYIVVSEPMIGSIPCSLVLIRTENGTDLEAMKNEIFANVDTRKWICVEASDLYATDYDNTIIFIMADETLVNMVKSGLDTILGTSKGKELTENRQIDDAEMGLDTGYEEEHLGDPIAP